MYAQYNEPNFSPLDGPTSSNAGPTKTNSNRRKSDASYNQLALREVQKQRSICEDCRVTSSKFIQSFIPFINLGGKSHKEIFPFIRSSRGPYEGQELEKIVIPIIKKWGDFVSNYVDV